MRFGEAKLNQILTIIFYGKKNFKISHKAWNVCVYFNRSIGYWGWEFETTQIAVSGHGLGRMNNWLLFSREYS